MEAVALVTLLALIQFFWFSFQVGGLRQKHGVQAPSITGDPEFECAFRVQQNTMEQLILFLPALWIFAHYGNPLWAAGIGLVYIIGRFVYRAGYLADASKRSTGFMIGFVATAVLIVGSLWHVGKALYLEYLT